MQIRYTVSILYQIVAETMTARQPFTRWLNHLHFRARPQRAPPPPLDCHVVHVSVYTHRAWLSDCVPTVLQSRLLKSPGWRGQDVAYDQTSGSSCLASYPVSPSPFLTPIHMRIILRGIIIIRMCIGVRKGEGGTGYEATSSQIARRCTIDAGPYIGVVLPCQHRDHRGPFSNPGYACRSKEPQCSMPLELLKHFFFTVPILALKIITGIVYNT